MRIFLVFSALVLLTGFALAQDNSSPSKFSQNPASTPLEKSQSADTEDQQATKSQQALRTAMNDEIALLTIAEKDAVAVLVAKLDQAYSSEDRLALQKQISEAKLKGWRDNLATQLKYAELGGYTEQAEDLRERVAQLDAGLSPVQAAQSSPRRVDAETNKGGQ
jgi:YesN/AraC family two-component response regulator